jgi:hypothetical protein
MPAGIIRLGAKQILDSLSELASQAQRDAHARLVRARLDRTKRLTRDTRSRSELNLGETSRAAGTPNRFSRCHANSSYAIVRAD